MRGSDDLIHYRNLVDAIYVSNYQCRAGNSESHNNHKKAVDDYLGACRKLFLLTVGSNCGLEVRHVEYFTASKFKVLPDVGMHVKNIGRRKNRKNTYYLIHDQGLNLGIIKLFEIISGQMLEVGDRLLKNAAIQWEQGPVYYRENSEGFHDDMPNLIGSVVAEIQRKATESMDINTWACQSMDLVRELRI